MSYFKQTKIEDENSNIINRVDLTSLPTRDLLIQIIKELQILNLNISLLTDNEITKEDIDTVG